MSEVWRPARIDRAWRGNVGMGLIERLETASVDDLRAAILELAARGPRNRLGIGLTDAGHWVYDRGRLVDTVQAMVHENSGLDDLAEHTLDFVRAHPVRGPEPTPSLHLGVGGGRLAYLAEHELWDGGNLSRLALSLNAMALSGHPVAMLEEPPATWALQRALLHTFTSPHRVRELFKERSRAQAESGWGEPFGSPEEGLAPGLVFAEVPAAARREIKQWAREHAPGTNDAVLTLALIRRALTQVGLVQDPTIGMVVDLRRYLARADRGNVHGNFISGLQMAVPLDAGPAELQARLTDVLDSGRPLAAFAVSLLKSMRHRYSPGVRRFAGQPFSHVFMGSRVGGAGGHTIPWSGDVRRMASWTNPVGQTGITALVTQLGQGWQISLCHYEGCVDSHLLAQAGHHVSQDPLGLLMA
ncbi:MAG: hypothetical protein Q4F67_01045 [Propionibacteriaceae bacterium]|nr:hypothetical protein [Propionibacteriaceae bacterium]